MSDVTVTRARARFSALLRRAEHERVRITRRGRVAAVVVSEADLERLEELDRLEDETDQAEFDQAEAEDDGVRIPIEEIAARLGVPT